MVNINKLDSVLVPTAVPLSLFTVDKFHFHLYRETQDFVVKHGYMSVFFKRNV